MNQNSLQYVLCGNLKGHIKSYFNHVRKKYVNGPGVADSDPKECFDRNAHRPSYTSKSASQRDFMLGVIKWAGGI